MPNQLQQLYDQAGNQPPAQPPAQPSTQPSTQPTPSSLQPTGQGNQVAPVQAPVGSSGDVTLPPATNLDPQVVALAQTIKGIESKGDYNAVGDKGSSVGAYQWNNGPTPVQPGQTPKNWQNAAKQFLGDANAPMSPQNQNYVAYQQIAAYKAQGLSPISIDALWNGAHPDSQNQGQYVHVSSQRAQTFLQALQQQSSQIPQTTQTQTDINEPPSVGGFLQNIAGSAGNFLGNLGQAVTHPITTAENLGSAGVGALQEMGGEQNTNTQAFDQIKNHFVNRYGSPQNLAHTIYTDPVGFAADLSSVLGIGGGAVGLAGKVADVAGLSGVGDVAGSVAGGLSKGATIANPLTLPIKGTTMALGGVSGPLASLVGKGANISGDTVKYILNGGVSEDSGATLAGDIGNALGERANTLTDTGGAYESLKNSSAVVPVAATDLAKIVEDNTGVIVDHNGSVIDAADQYSPMQVRALQSVVDRFQPMFDRGELTAADFQLLRSTVDNKLANFGQALPSIKDKTLAVAGRGMYDQLNQTYRPAFSGTNGSFIGSDGQQYASLEDMDNSYSTQKTDLEKLSKGFIDKNGNLLDSATNKVRNAGKVGNQQTLARLEEIVPGATQRLQAIRAIEEIQKAFVGGGGGLTGSLLKTGEVGGLITGIATGNLYVAGVSLATAMLASPDYIIPVLEFLGKHQKLVPFVVKQLARVATTGAVDYAAQGGPSTTSLSTPQEQSTQPETAQPTPTLPDSTSLQSPRQLSSSSLPQSITSSPGYQAAIKARYKPEEISAYLQSIK